MYPSPIFSIINSGQSCFMYTPAFPPHIFFFNKFIHFIYFWLHWVFIAARGLSLVAASGGQSSLQCAGLSLQWLLLLPSRGSRCAGFSSCGMWALERRLSSCDAQAQLLRGMWDPPWPGLEPVPPAPAGGFSTTAPPGKPPPRIFLRKSHIHHFIHKYFSIYL